ncbi:MAG: APC family permease [Bryobacteraceae bacterium]|jgi:amino acid transporter
MDSQTAEPRGLHRELGLTDLVLAQVLNVVGSSWVGIAARLGRAHTVFWLAAMALFYLPLAAVVVSLNRLMPLEGGLYQWAKAGFGEMTGFLTAWNLWFYAVVSAASILFVIPTDISFMIGPGAAWLPGNRLAAPALIGVAMAAITLVAIHGLDIAKWLHNSGSVMILTAYVILISLPVWALMRGTIQHYDPLPWAWPRLNSYSLAVFGQMSVGGLSGFEYVAILAGECRRPEKTIGRSVVIATPIIALMFILGTSSVLAFLSAQNINVIGPIPQTMRAAMGPGMAPFAILLLLGRAVAAASLLFTGLTRLPMTAGWDRLVPAWFSRLDPRRGTPVRSILFTAALMMALILLSMLGVREQEASQLLTVASTAHYAIAYAALFAIPLLGARALVTRLPAWLKFPAAAGLATSLVSLAITIRPIVDVVSRTAYAAKICTVVVIVNGLGVLIYRARPGSR